MTEDCDIVVAGGGIAGLTAGLTAARLGRKTFVLTGNVLGGHLLSIEKIDGYPGYPDGIAGYELCPTIQAQGSDAGAAFAMAELDSLEADGDVWRVVGGGNQYIARAVILATGTSFRTLGVPGEERLFGKGVSHCASCDAPILRGKPVVVIGGGDSALQEALTLAEYAASVTILTEDAALTAQPAYQAPASTNPKIDIRYGVSVQEILGESVVTGVRLADGQEIAAGGVFVFIGLQPNTAPFDGLLPLDEAGRIAVDETMRTSLPGVLAAGTIRHGMVGRAAASAGDGATAAIAADRYLTDGTWREI